MRRVFAVVETVLSAVYALQLPLHSVACPLNVAVDDSFLELRTEANVSYGGTEPSGKII